MIARTFRRLRTGWLTGGLHLLILWIAAEADSAAAWPYALAAMAGVSFCAWTANYRRYRQVHDVPTSRIASAAQGYCEFFGRSRCIPDSPLRAPLSAQPCCWYRYDIERRAGRDKWEHVDGGESVAHFLLVDDSGQCIVSPDGAEVLYTERNRWVEGEHRYTEELLLPERALYAIGEFSTVSQALIETEENTEVSHLLADWKRDQATLLERFDSDRSGTLDLEEWEGARLAARTQVRRERAALIAAEGVHLLRKPADGRVFILAGALPNRIGRRYALWSFAHLVVFFGAGAGALLLLRP